MVKHTRVLRSFILLAILFSYFSGIKEDALAIDPIYNEDEIISRYTYNITYSLNIDTSNSGNLQVWWIMPKNNSYQNIYSLEYN